MQRVVILGAGFGGLELATRLSEDLPGEVDVTLVDKRDSFVLGFAKLDVMFGRKSVADVSSSYTDIAKPGVTFRQETVESIDPEARRVVTDKGTYDADVLVVALGADLDPAATPGLDEGGYEFYSVAGAERVAEVLPSFGGGTVLISILGPFFKCPPAPFETAFMLHEYLTGRGVPSFRIRVLSPLPSPIPLSPETSQAILAALAARRIEFWPKSVVGSIDPLTRQASVTDGPFVPFDLFLGIPVHKAPDVVVESGLAVDGWVPVDPATFATRFDGVYAVGDVTSAPVPRAGVFAEGEASTVADVLVAQIRGGSAAKYEGAAACYLDFGPAGVGRVNVNFMGGPAPTAHFTPPSAEGVAEKAQFGATRLARWFGSPSA